MVGLVDEAKGGIIAYFLDEFDANLIAHRMNERYNTTQECRWWITHDLDEQQIADLKRTIDEQLAS